VETIPAGITLDVSTDAAGKAVGVYKNADGTEWKNPTAPQPVTPSPAPERAPEREPERAAAEDDGPIALTGEAVAQIEDAFYQADDFEVPYETRQGIATWARSMLRSGAEIDEAAAIEHLTSPHFGLDQKTAKKLVEWYLKSATTWNEG
jgi:hypothetical protein